MYIAAYSLKQFELDEVNTNHQREMQDILSDAASKIKRFKEQLASKQGQLNTEAQVNKDREHSAKGLDITCSQTSSARVGVAHGWSPCMSLVGVIEKWSWCWCRHWVNPCTAPGPDVAISSQQVHT